VGLQGNGPIYAAINPFFEGQSQGSSFNLSTSNVLKIMVHFEGIETLPAGSETITLTGPATNITKTIFFGGAVPYQDYFLIGMMQPGTYTVMITSSHGGIDFTKSYTYIEAFTYAVPNTKR
jgi:hypothetical protein